MAQETNQSQAPLLCPTGCGFYGSPRNNGMCSVCYKDFLQRQNSNGRISPPGLSSTDSSIGESFLAQCPDTTTVPVSTAISHTDVASGLSSGVTTASETSTDESTSGMKASLKADDLPSSCVSVRAAALGSGQEGQSSPAGSSGTVSASQSTVLRKGTSLEECSRNGKRKREDTDENIDGDRAPVSEDSVQVSTETAEKPKAKKNRCFTCRKKIGLTGFDCRCGNVFCSMHRYSDTHNCSFDYKAEAAEKIRKENPVIVGEKIQKI